MKKLLSIVSAFAVLAAFGLFALGSSESEDDVVDQGATTTTVADGENGQEDTVPAEDPTVIGDYKVDIKSYRLAKDYEGKDTIVITYGFTNVKHDDAVSFAMAIEDSVFQNGVGLNESYFDSEYNTSTADNQSKEIKAGASLDVEVAYELNDTTTDVVVEISELFSFSDKTLTRTFSLA